MALFLAFLFTQEGAEPNSRGAGTDAVTVGE